MRLIYAWICMDEKHFLNDCGIVLTDGYDISYSSQTRVLTVRKTQPKLPDRFYTVSENTVTGIACFTGKNGSGKTSVLRHLFQTDPEGNFHYPAMRKPSPERSTVQVFEEDGTLYVCSDFPVKADCDVPYQLLVGKTPKPVTKIFVSNSQYESVSFRGPSERKFAFTPTDMAKLQSRFFDRILGLDEHYGARNNFYLYQTHFKEHASPWHLYNVFYAELLRGLVRAGKREKFGYLKNARATFLAADETDSFIDEAALYNLVVNRMGLERILGGKGKRADSRAIAECAERCKLRAFDSDLLTVCAVFALARKRTDYDMEKISGKMYFNLTAELLVALSDFGHDLTALPSYRPADLLSRLEEDITTSSRGKGGKNALLWELDYLKGGLVSIERLEKAAEGERDGSLPADSAALLDLLHDEILSGGYLLKYYFLDLGCSAGERAYLNLFSWLNFIPLLKEYGSGAVRLSDDVIFFLDEPDLYCHPEWQRKLLYELIRTFELQYGGKHIQIVFSTHSPLFLSDIPNVCIYQVERTEEGAKILPMQKPTFGANLFDLYNDGFYLNSFIGEFAKFKIAQAVEELSRPLPTDEMSDLNGLIELIGEPIIRNSLKKMYRRARKEQP